MKQFGVKDRYYYRQLNEKQKRNCERIRLAMMHQQDSVHLSCSPEDVKILFEALNFDHAEMFWVDFYKMECLYCPGFCELHISYFFQPHEKKALEDEVNEWKRKVCSQIPANVSAAEKVWMIYDYLARQVTYRDDEVRLSSTIIGPMKKNLHTGVCEGISKAFKLLCDEIGIPCIIVGGYAKPFASSGGPHAWNMVRIGNTCRHVDATWEIRRAQMRGIADDRSFLKKDIAMTRYQFNRADYPACI